MYVLENHVSLNWSLSTFIPQGQVFRFPVVMSVCVVVCVCVVIERMSAREGDMSASIIQGIVVLCCECLWEERRRRTRGNESKREVGRGKKEQQNRKTCQI